MLAGKIASCIIAVTLFYLARRADYGYSNSEFIFSSSALDVTGIIAVICFSVAMTLTNLNFYTVPKILLLISVCIYVRYKKRKRFCTPLWKSLKVIAPLAIVFIGSDATIELVKLFANGGSEMEFLIMVSIACVGAIGLSIVLTNSMLSCMLSKKRAYKFYY